jgi:hypothetical protein
MAVVRDKPEREAPADPQPVRDRERVPRDPQRGVNHTSALTRILERRIRRLEEAVFGRQSDRSAGSVTSQGKMTRNATDYTE